MTLTRVRNVKVMFCNFMYQASLPVTPERELLSAGIVRDTEKVKGKVRDEVICKLLIVKLGFVRMRLGLLLNMRRWKGASSKSCS